MNESTPPRVPGWVKWPGLVLLLLVAVFLVLKAFGVEHGPGRHMSPGDSPASVAPGMHGGGHG